MKKLTTAELNNELAQMKGWAYENYFLKKKFIFKDHKSAFSFIAKVALIAEKLNHHPNWSGVFNEVLIRLSTHEVNDVTTNDIEFANEIENSL
jgi:4a-hydroxytetrahydrobiopterin dehydratase